MKPTYYKYKNIDQFILLQNQTAPADPKNTHLLTWKCQGWNSPNSDTTNTVKFQHRIRQPEVNDGVAAEDKEKVKVVYKLHEKNKEVM